jgi:uncharacterized membrane protein
MTPPPGAVLFQALIVPHRSLSPRGVALLCFAIFVISALLALRFWFMGAWPVAGFSVVEVALAVFLLRLNMHRARQSELLLLSEQTLRIVRTDWRGTRREQELPAAWLQVCLESRPATVSRLMVGNRRDHVEIAMSLGEEQKRSLAEALDAALRRARNPEFDNPQLR